MNCPVCDGPLTGTRVEGAYCSTACGGLARAVDHAPRAPIDRALGRDHSLCGAEPCSDCR